jgi:hypothetical protein
MRFMILVKADEASEAGVMPSEKQLADMGRYNEELVNAGVLLAGEGLHPSSRGARVVFDGSNRAVMDGPFGTPAHLVAGFWLIQARSREEAIEWVKRIPFETGEVEVRQVFEADDFGPALSAELREQEGRLRARVADQVAT